MYTNACFSTSSDSHATRRALTTYTEAQDPANRIPSLYQREKKCAVIPRRSSLTTPTNDKKKKQAIRSALRTSWLLVFTAQFFEGQSVRRGSLIDNHAHSDATAILASTTAGRWLQLTLARQTLFHPYTNASQTRTPQGHNPNSGSHAACAHKQNPQPKKQAVYAYQPCRPGPIVRAKLA